MPSQSVLTVGGQQQHQVLQRQTIPLQSPLIPKHFGNVVPLARLDDDVDGIMIEAGRL